MIAQKTSNAQVIFMSPLLKLEIFKYTKNNTIWIIKF